MRETFVEGVHGAAPRRVLGVVGEQQLAAAVAVLGDDVELDRVDPGEQRGLKRRERVAGCDVVGALVADAPHAWHPAHQYVMRLSSPWPPLLDRLAAARAGLARLRVDDAVCVLHAVQRGLLHAGPRRAHDRERLVVGDLADGAPRVDPRGEAALALPQIADAGDRALVEQRVADRARRVVLAQPAQEARLVELGGEDVGPEPGDLWCSRVRAWVSSSSTGPSNWTTSPRSVRRTSQARRAARRQRWPSR